MPELPEVETVKRGLAPVLAGQAINSVVLGDKGLRKPFQKGLAGRLEGRRIIRLDRRAKYILVHLNTQRILVLHLGMSGRIRVLPPGSNLPPEKHDHFQMTLENGARLILNDARRFGMVFDLPGQEFNQHPAFAHLGPEPLSEEFNPQYLKKTCKNKKIPIKTAIMDQRIVVGVGNIYACEALYRAGISPLRSAGSLTDEEAAKLVLSICAVLEEAIRCGGSTLRDHRLTDGDFGYFQQKLAVYGREGLACLDCSCHSDTFQGVLKISQGGRSTFYCPGVQE